MSKVIGVLDPDQWQPSEQERTWLMAHGLLTVDDNEVHNFRCIRCGSCCRVNLCAKGRRRDGRPENNCEYLVTAEVLSDGSRLTKCALPAEGDDPHRQIGRGCCAPWLPRRNKLLAASRAGQNDLLEQLGNLK